MNAPPGQPPGGGPPPGPQYPVQAPQPQQPQQPQPGPMSPQQPYGYPAAPIQKKNETLGIVSIVLAAAAWLMQFHIFLSVPAVIVGFMALRKIKADPDNYGGDGMAKAGIAVGLVNVVMSFFGLLMFILWIVFAILMETM